MKQFPMAANTNHKIVIQIRRKVASKRKQKAYSGDRSSQMTQSQLPFVECPDQT